MTTNYKLSMDDSVVKAVVDSYKERSERGIKKYGVTLDREDLTFTDWVNHAQEEAKDLTLYLEKIKRINTNLEILLLDLLFRYDNKEISKKEFINTILNYV